MPDFWFAKFSRENIISKKKQVNGGSWYFICCLHTAEVADSLVAIPAREKWCTTFKMQVDV